MIWKKSETTWIYEPDHFDRFELELHLPPDGLGIAFTIDSNTGWVQGVNLLAPAMVALMRTSLCRAPQPRVCDALAVMVERLGLGSPRG